MQKAVTDPTSNVHVRRAVVADAGALSEVGTATFHLACPPNTPQADIDLFVSEWLSPDAFTGHLIDPKSFCFIAEAEGSAVGYSMFYHARAPAFVPGTNPIELKKLYVLPGWHGRGVAKRLVGLGEGEASRRGYETMWLSVSEVNAKALSFYHRMGFREVGRRDFLVGNDVQKDKILSKSIVG